VINVTSPTGIRAIKNFGGPDVAAIIMGPDRDKAPEIGSFPYCSLSAHALTSTGKAGAGMVQRVATVAFEGIEARAVDVQVQVAPGLPAFNVVGLPDKAVSEARERVRAGLVASGLALPARRITVNLAPADLPKEGSHYDLPIALGLMAAIGAIPADALAGFTVLGELGLDGSIAAVAGVLPAAIGANARSEGLICPGTCGAEAAWASPEMEIIAASSLIQLANHFRGTQVLARPQPRVREFSEPALDLKDIKGQESAKRALEVAAAGGHNLIMIGPPGAGKSMLAARLPTILPPLAPAELLEVSMIASVAGEIEDGALTNRRPFRAPHHSASMPALVGGGLRARPGEALRTMASSSSTSFPSFSRMRLKRCGSPWKAARSPSRGRTIGSPIRRASCSLPP
jgi:magnesium chelatase family protein